MVRYRFTYDLVTPESAADGEASESGFYSPPGCAGGHFDVSGEGNGDYHSDPASERLVDSILETINGVSHVQECGERLTVYGHSDSDPYTAAEESRAVHFEAHPRLIRALAARFRAE